MKKTLLLALATLIESPLFKPHEYYGKSVYNKDLHMCYSPLV